MSKKPQHTLRWIVIEGMTAGVMINLVSGVFLIKLALDLGASPMHIGLLAALPFLGQLMQLPAILMLARLGRRKIVSVTGSSIHRLAILATVPVPFIEDKALALKLLVALVAIRECGLGISSAGWYGWMRDLIPKNMVSRIFGRRLYLTTFIGTLFALGAGFALDHAAEAEGELVRWVFSSMFLLSGVAGLFSLYVWIRTPDVPIKIIPSRAMFMQMIEPFYDDNFRRVLLVLFLVMFAVNMAVPFFPVFMLEVLKIQASVVVALWAMGQFMQMPFFTWWGWVSDRYSQTTALNACLPFLAVGLLLWPLTALPDQHMFTWPLLVVIHLLVGAGLAGTTLASQIMAMRIAPENKTTGYVALASQLSSIAAATAALTGGYLAEKWMAWHVSLRIQWTKNHQEIGDVVAYEMGSYEFLFIFSALVVLLIVPLIGRVRDVGQHVPRKVINKLLQRRVVTMFRSMTTVGGMRLLQYPFEKLAKMPKKRTRQP